MSQIWFLYVDDIVSGPFTTDQVNSQLGSGQVSPNAFIWWKGQTEWIPLKNWQSQLSDIMQSMQKDVRKQNQVWYMDIGNSQVGPITQTELIEHLKATPHLNKIRLWSVGMKQWTSLFELGEVMDLLGLSRRENLRAPIMGTVAVNRSTDDPKGFVLKATTISVAGMGVSGSHDLRAGDLVSLVIKSNGFKSSIHLRGEVTYVTSQNFAGIRFLQAPAETQSLILAYVKKFSRASSPASSAA